MPWFKKPKYTLLKSAAARDRIPEGLWTKCDNCVEVIVTKEFDENLKVCRKCGHHHKLSARERIELLTDEGTFKEMFQSVQPTDALGFVDSKAYPDRLKKAQQSSGY